MDRKTHFAQVISFLSFNYKRGKVNWDKFLLIWVEQAQQYLMLEESCMKCYNERKDDEKHFNKNIADIPSK